MTRRKRFSPLLSPFSRAARRAPACERRLAAARHPRVMLEISDARARARVALEHAGERVPERREIARSRVEGFFISGVEKVVPQKGIRKRHAIDRRDETKRLRRVFADDERRAERAKVQRHAETPRVRQERVVRLAGRALGGHVRRRADQVETDEIVVFFRDKRRRAPEIGEFRDDASRAVVAQQNVFRFHVPVRDAVLVNERQRVQEVARDVPRALDRKRREIEIERAGDGVVVGDVVVVFSRLRLLRLLRGFSDGSFQVPPVGVLQHERDVRGARVVHHVEEPHDVHVRRADVAQPSQRLEFALEGRQSLVSHRPTRGGRLVVVSCDILGPR
mmetsp:Transcript_741/g.3042  ORF Transcript_741/g.3042 Transcript_741/m.3042 type:complete len:334 (+) Transcript_741:879-1880(+)